MRLFYIFGLLISWTAAAQQQPVKWSFDAFQKPDGKVILSFMSRMDNGWHIYTQNIHANGPVPTIFNFENNSDFTLEGPVRDLSQPTIQLDPIFSQPVPWFESSAAFEQEVTLHVPATVIRGSVTFMACNDFECRAPEIIRFSVAAKTEIPVIAQHAVLVSATERPYAADATTSGQGVVETNTISMILLAGITCAAAGIALVVVTLCRRKFRKPA